VDGNPVLVWFYSGVPDDCVMHQAEQVRHTLGSVMGSLLLDSHSLFQDLHQFPALKLPEEGVASSSYPISREWEDILLYTRSKRLQVTRSKTAI
jgi:hypothetical protein